MSADQPMSRGDMADMIELQQILASNHRILFQGTSPYQNILILESTNLRMYVDGQLQFSSLDERIFHEALVHPALMMAPSRNKVLLIGGENGLALREILKYRDVEQVDLIDVDPLLLQISLHVTQIAAMNNNSFADRRVHIYEEDLLTYLERTKQTYDVIIIDLPDPVDKQISTLYTKEFFAFLSRYMTKNGLLACQAESPQGRPKLFWSIASTIQSSGLNTLSYHVLIPSFGDWGFHLAGKSALSWKGNQGSSVKPQTLPKDLSTLFDFPDKVDLMRQKSVVNTVKRPVLHRFYENTAQAISSVPNARVINQSKNRAGNRFSSPWKINSYEKNRPNNDKSRHTYSPFTTTSPLQQSVGSLQDQIELKQLQAGHHRILYKGNSQNHSVLILEINDLRMYLDGQLQFSSMDERIYHEALVHPALVFAPSRKRVLILGGGDGLAMREVLKYPDVECVDLVDLDPMVLNTATNLSAISSLNSKSLLDNRARVYAQDAQEFLNHSSKTYDVIIIDFPDPADKKISCLYTKEFFKKLKSSLSAQGLIVCQAYSPEEAPLVYWSIGQTIASAGFNTASYHVYVPTFGDWGFHLAGSIPQGQMNVQVPRNTFTMPSNLTSMFLFPDKVSQFKSQAKVNTLEKLILHKLYIKEVGS